MSSTNPALQYAVLQNMYELHETIGSGTIHGLLGY